MNYRNSLFVLNKIEKIRISEKQFNFEEFFLIGVILEIQEYKTSTQKKIFKLIFEDFNGIAIGIIFEKQGQIHHKTETFIGRKMTRQTFR